MELAHRNSLLSINLRIVVLISRAAKMLRILRGYEQGCEMLQIPNLAFTNATVILFLSVAPLRNDKKPVLNTKYEVRNTKYEMLCLTTLQVISM